MNKRSKNSNFINFGTYPVSETDVLKTEFEKRGIPVKILYPGTKIGRESTAQARWTAYTILIPVESRKQALEVCRGLNIKPKSKIPLPKALYTKTTRYLLGILIVLWLFIIALGILGVLENRMILGGLISSLILISMILLIISIYKSPKS